MFDWGTVVLTAVIQVGIGIFFKRFIEKRDEQVDKLETEVAKMRDEKLVRVEKDIEHGKTSRGRLHDEIETLNARSERHDQQLLQLDRSVQGFNDAVLKLERVSQQVTSSADRIEDLQQHQRKLTVDVAAVVERIKDLQK